MPITLLQPTPAKVHAIEKQPRPHTESAAATPAARAWAQVLAPYRKPSNGRGIVEIVITIVPFVVLWLLMWATLDLGYWLVLLLAIPAARRCSRPPAW